MLLVHAPGAASDPVLTPWARVVRHESVRDLEGNPTSRFYTLDAVHSSYFETYMHEYVEPLSLRFNE
jgi:hypothetical protein